jgi:hypothetical protein
MGVGYLRIQTHTQNKKKRYSSPVTGLEWPRRFHEVKVPRYKNGTGWW